MTMQNIIGIMGPGNNVPDSELQLAHTLGRAIAHPGLDFGYSLQEDAPQL